MNVSELNEPIFLLCVLGGGGVEAINVSIDRRAERRPLLDEMLDIDVFWMR